MTVFVALDDFDDEQPTAKDVRDFKHFLASKRALNINYGLSPLQQKDAIIFNGELQSVLVRKPAEGQKCVIDWLNIVIKASHFYPDERVTRHDVFADETGNSSTNFTNEEKQYYAVKYVANNLQRLIGFGLDSENPTGRNFYNRSWNLEHGTGFIAIGGQNNTIMISINGTGCTYANVWWEHLLFGWLEHYGDDVRITRIDLAYDALDNHFLSVDLFNEIHSKGGFTNGGRPPDIEYRGNWKKPNGRGRTLYIGSRQSSKFCRIYEKGKQLGDEKSNWLRIEVEYKSRDVYIPLDVLLEPTQYFLASYPCFNLIDKDCDDSNRFDARDKDEFITFDNALNILKRQYGRYLHFFRMCYQDDKELLDILTDIPNLAVPNRLDILTIPRQFHPQISDKFGITFTDDED